MLFLSKNKFFRFPPKKFYNIDYRTRTRDSSNLPSQNVTQPVWSDARIKSSPIFSEVSPKEAKLFLTFKQRFLK